MTTIGDLVLVYYQDGPAFFARIEDICADSKPDWYQVKLLILQIPVAETVWILKEAYINGETFTMDDKRIRLEKVKGANKEEGQFYRSDRGSKKRSNHGNDKVISLLDRKKRN